MKPDKITAKLNDTHFLLGGFRRKSAIKKLLASPTAADLGLLVKALDNNHPDADKILAGLRHLHSKREPQKIAYLWEAFAQYPHPDLAVVLTKQGWPKDLPIPTVLIRKLLATATPDADAKVIAALAVFATALPVTDEIANDEIYTAWLRRQSHTLDKLITEQKRQPANPALKALHALVNGILHHYQNLNDTDGKLLIKAYTLAPQPFRERIARTVAKSTDSTIKEAFRLALMSADLSPAERIASLKQVNDQDGLFEQVRSLNLLQTLDLCQYWASQTARPSRPAQAAVVDRVVTAYRSLGRFLVEPVPKLPEGMVDIFEYWHEQRPFDSDLRHDLKNKDPFTQARGLYLGAERNLLDESALTAAAISPHWPLRLIARLVDPNNITPTEDHVLWVSACAGDALLLQAPIAGSPDDYARHCAQLTQAKDTAATGMNSLLEILCAFQGAFIAHGTSLAEPANHPPEPYTAPPD